MLDTPAAHVAVDRNPIRPVLEDFAVSDDVRQPAVIPEPEVVVVDDLLDGVLRRQARDSCPLELRFSGRGEEEAVIHVPTDCRETDARFVENAV